MTLRKLFSDESKWIKYCMARDANNIEVDCRAKEAVCWCLAAGILVCYNSKKCKEVESYIKEKYGISLISFNNHPNTNFQTILQLIEELSL